MRPVLFQVWGIAVPAYGLTMMVLFVGGLVLLRRRVRGLGVSDEHLLDFAAIAGATIMAWVGIGMILFWLGIGGAPHFNALPVLAIGAFGFLFYSRRKNLPAERIFDALAPIAALALALQYGIGTLLAGTAFGKPTSLPWGLSFPAGSPAYKAYGAQTLHPVQLYLGASFLIVAIAAAFAPARLADGQRALITFITIAAIYLATSPLRGNTTSLLSGQTPRLSELVALFVLVFCSIIAWCRRGAAKAGA
jgi:phosphatidylglycerol:prolipoprotein diacylglycerol transferase